MAAQSSTSQDAGKWLSWLGAYGISKFGIEGMSQTWAAELEEAMCVNWVDPGDMNTAMHRAAEPDEDPTQWANPADVTEVLSTWLQTNHRTNGQRFQAQSDNWGRSVTGQGQSFLTPRPLTLTLLILCPTSFSLPLELPPKRPESDAASPAIKSG